MDEPTSVLTEHETDDLFISLKQFSKDGILIIYITHKLKEVLSLCDEVAVMRKGKVVSVSNTIDEKIESLANKMVGENLNNLNLSLKKGECLGIAGISGNGQNELFQILSGEIITEGTSIMFRNKEIGKLNPRERREYLMAFSPEDRISQAAVPELSLIHI